jgi:predicted signal transduction protein with EAL and GGDEF domain
VSLSVGVCTLQVSPEATPATLITRADQALYQAKRDGRHRWVRYVAPGPVEEVAAAGPRPVPTGDAAG